MQSPASRVQGRDQVPTSLGYQASSLCHNFMITSLSTPPSTSTPTPSSPAFAGHHCLPCVPPGACLGQRCFSRGGSVTSELVRPRMTTVLGARIISHTLGTYAGTYYIHSHYSTTGTQYFPHPLFLSHSLFNLLSLLSLSPRVLLSFHPSLIPSSSSPSSLSVSPFFYLSLSIYTIVSNYYLCLHSISLDILYI